MASPAELTYQLSEETGLGVEICKLALERGRNDLESAKSILHGWFGGNAGKRPNEFGLTFTFLDKDFNAAAAVQLKCTNELFAGSKEFFNLAEDIATEIVQYEHPYINEPSIEGLEAKHNCKITFDSKRITKSSPLSLLTTYTHKNRIGVVVETIAPNQDIYNNKLFRLFSFDCALHIAAFAPLAIKKEEVDEKIQDQFRKSVEKELMRTGKALAMWKPCIEGKLHQWLLQRSLMTQKFIKSSDTTVEEKLAKLNKKLETDIKIHRFVRMEFPVIQDVSTQN